MKIPPCPRCGNQTTQEALPEEELQELDGKCYPCETCGLIVDFAIVGGQGVLKPPSAKDVKKMINEDFQRAIKMVEAYAEWRKTNMETAKAWEAEASEAITDEYVEEFTKGLKERTMTSAPCPHCGESICVLASPIGETDTKMHPTFKELPGYFRLCGHCLKLSTYNDDKTIRALTQKEYKEVMAQEGVGEKIAELQFAKRIEEIIKKQEQADAARN